MWYWVSSNTTQTRDELLDKLMVPVLAAPVSTAAPIEHHPGLSPPNIPAPSWYKGDHSAFRSSIQAAKDHGLRPEAVT